jgi:hypothetical protein
MSLRLKTCQFFHSSMKPHMGAQDDGSKGGRRPLVGTHHVTDNRSNIPQGVLEIPPNNQIMRGGVSRIHKTWQRTRIMSWRKFVSTPQGAK